MELVWSDIGRPNQAFVVIKLFCNSSNRPRNTNAIAAHYHWFGSPIFVQVYSIHCFTIASSKLEYMSNLNSFSKNNGSLTIWRRVPFLDKTEISKPANAKVSVWIHIDIMIVFFIRPTHTINHRFNRVIGNDFNILY